MKSLILAGVFTFGYALAITLTLRSRTIRSRAGVMTQIFLASVPLYILAHAMTPPDLGFLPAAFVERWYPIDLAFGLLVYGAGFFGGVLQLYNLADRGFSLRILIDIHESPDHALNVAGVAGRYSAGKGIRWMYDKRLDDMQANKLILISGEDAVLTPRGALLARVFGRLREWLRMDFAR